jgi:hypothetical protein
LLALAPNEARKVGQVGTAVNLEVSRDDRRAFERASAPQRELVVEYYHVPDFEPVHLLDWSLLDNHVAHFLAIVAAAPKPVYVHCLDGIDRSNVLIASYRVLVEGVNPEDAIRDIERFDSPWLHVDAKYIRGLNARRAAILEKASKWRAHLTPAAKIECSHGRCTYSRRASSGLACSQMNSERALRRAELRPRHMNPC